MKVARANSQDTIAGLKMELWEKPGAKRGKDTGGLLILSAKLGDRELFGLGFAPKDDDQGTGAILKAIQSLKQEGGDDGDGEKDKDGK
jgi:hypothetical protein